MKYIWKDTFKSIRQSLSKFITLTCIVMLGVSFFVGLQAAPPSMANSIEFMDDAANLHDYQIISTLGFEQEDIDDLLSNEYIKAVQPYYFLDCLTKRGKSVDVIRLEGKSEGSIDKYTIVEGRDIENKNEIVILSPGDASKAALGDFNNSYPEIGDVITVYLDKTDITKSIHRQQYTVVGYYTDSKYITKMLDTSTLDAQMLSYVGIIDASNFIMDAIPSVMITLNGTDSLDSFSQDYQDFMDETNSVLDATFNDAASKRTNKIIGEANDTLNEAREDYQEGVDTFNQEIQDATDKIVSGQNELNNAYIDLVDGQNEFETKKQDGINELRENEQKIIDGKAELAKQEAVFQEEKASALAKLQDAKATLDANNSEIQKQKQNLAEQLSERREIKFNDQTIIIYIDFSWDSFPTYDNAVYQAYELAKQGNSDVNSIASIITSEDFVNGVINDFKDKIVIEIDGNDSSADTFEVLAQASVFAEFATQYKQENPDATVETINGAYNNWKETNSEDYKARLVYYLEENQKTLEQLIHDALLNDDLKALIVELGKLPAGEGLLRYGFETYQANYDYAMAQFESAQAKIDQAKAALVEGSEQIIEGWDSANQEFANAQATLNDGWNEYNQGVSDINDAKKELEEAKIDGQKKLNDAAKEIEDAQNEIDDIEPCEWIVLDRGSHYSTVMYRNTISTMKGIGALFPLFFILVAILVCLTTMTRMVEEERTLIGTYRSLGFSRIQSCAKFLFYALLASLLGSILGAVIGLIVFPVIIYNAWGMMYLNPEFKLVIPWTTIALISFMFILLMVGTTYVTCHANMKEVPAQLMRPHAPKSAKKTVIERIPWIWNRLNFTMKVTVRNLFRYKKRFFMTVLGVGGCTSLIVCGFGVKDSVSAIGTVQYGQLYRFDGSVSFDNLNENEFKDKLFQYSQLDIVDNVLPINFSNVTVKGNVDQSSYLYVVGQNDLAKAFDLHDYKTRTPIVLSDSGIVISKRLAQYYDLSVGDTLTIQNNDNQQYDFKIEGICEMYIYHHIFMTSSAYQSAFNTKIQDNTIAFDTNDEVALTQFIQADNDVSGYNFASTVISFVNNLIEGFGIIVIVLVSSAGALAFVVLGNLTSVNISERLREIATLKVLGFTRKEVHHYVYYENIILTMIGGIVGLWFGQLELSMIMGMIQMDNIAFKANIQPISYAIAYGLTIIFAMCVNTLMQRKLDNIDMVESLKSIE